MRSSAWRLRRRISIIPAFISVVLAACGSAPNQSTPAGTAAAPVAETGATGPVSANLTPLPGSTRAAAPGSGAEATGVPAGTTQVSADGATGGADSTANSFKLNPSVTGTVEFWHFWGSALRHNAIRRVITICNQKLPNITVNETFKPFDDIWTANIAAVAAGQGMPDVIVEDRPRLPQRAADGIATNLGDFARRDGIDGSQFWPFTWQQTLYQGNPYGLPFETDVRVLFYNKNAFREVGLDPEKPPRTWTEVEEYAAKLNKRKDDGTYDRIGFMPLIRADPAIWGYTNDVEWITRDGKPQLNSPRAVETLEWIKSWVDRYGGWQQIQDFRAEFTAPPLDEFMSGRVAMVADIAGYNRVLDFYAPKFKNAAGNEETLEWGVADLPYNTDKGTWSGGFALSIPRGAPNAEAAWEFIKCTAGPEGALSWSRDTYAIPAIKAAAHDPVLLADPHYKVAAEAMEYSSGGHYYTPYPNWGEQLSQRYEQIWTGELDPKEALQAAQAAVEAGPP